MGRRGPISQSKQIQAPAGPPECPKDFDAVEKSIWRRICADLTDVGTMAKTDRASLTELVLTIARRDRLLKTIRDEGETWQDDKGNYKPRPESTIATQLTRIIIALEDRFGLTPAGRMRVSSALDKGDETDALTDF